MLQRDSLRLPIFLMSITNKNLRQSNTTMKSPSNTYPPTKTHATFPRIYSRRTTQLLLCSNTASQISPFRHFNQNTGLETQTGKVVHQNMSKSIAFIMATRTNVELSPRRKLTASASFLSCPFGLLLARRPVRNYLGLSHHPLHQR